MREVHCQNCKTINRLAPKCGNCQAEISEPRLIRSAWWLYDHRKDDHLVYLAVAVALSAGYFAATGWPFSPHSSEECREDAARSARSNEAMSVLLGLCGSKFPAKPAAK